MDWLRDEEADELALKQALADVLDYSEWPCLPPNPCRLKGLANLLRRMAPVYMQRREQRAAPDDGAPAGPIDLEEAIRLLIVASIYQFHPVLYRRWEASPDLIVQLREWVTRSTDLDAPPPLFADLELPRRVTTDETTPTPSYQMENAFPDPAEGAVLWIQPLLVGLDPAVRGEDFLPYLRSGRRSSP